MRRQERISSLIKLKIFTKSGNCYNRSSKSGLSRIWEVIVFEGEKRKTLPKQGKNETKPSFTRRPSLGFEASFIARDECSFLNFVEHKRNTMVTAEIGVSKPGCDRQVAASIFSKGITWF